MSRAESDAIGRRRRVRNIALFAALLGVALLFYAISIVKMTKG